jgi:hypothetical protein
MPAGSYASRHPTSLCSQRRRCHAGSAVGGATASAGLPLGAPRLRADDGSEISGCRLAILARRLMQTIRQCWSEQAMVQFPDWSRLRGRAVAWDDPQRRKWAKAPMQQAGQLGTEKAGHMRTAKKFHATRKHQRMRRLCCQGSESTYPFPSEAAKVTKPRPAQLHLDIA